MAADDLATLVRHQALEGPYSLLSFHHPVIAREARPGQFAMLKAGEVREPPLRRPFSIMSVDRRAETFTLFVKSVGPGTRALCALAPGEEALCLGPLGRPFNPPPPGTEALLVAGGYGIAPFQLYLETFGPKGVRVFYGGRTARDVQGREGFSSVSMTTTTEDGSVGHKGLVTERLEAHLDKTPGPSALYGCGPDAMLAALARIAKRRDLHCQLSLDPWMGCGVGTCLSCVVKIRRNGDIHHSPACTEGPVFEAARVVFPEGD